MKKTILIALSALLFVTLEASAQESFGILPHTEKNHSVSLSAPMGVDLQYAYEHPLGRRGSIVGRVGVHGAGAWGYNMIFGSYSYWMVAPSIDIEPRFYYGLDRRERHGRGTEMNAGSFVALQMKTILPLGYISDSNLTINGGTAFTPMWGLRRVWGAGWMFEFTAGASVLTNWGGGVDWSPYTSVRFGYAF